MSKRITRFDSLLPPEACVVETSPDQWNRELTPEEELAVRDANQKRRKEFAAGGGYARAALAEL